MSSTLLLNKLTTLLMHSGKKKLIFKKVIKNLQKFNLSNTKHPKAIKNICLLTTLFHKLKPFLETRKIRKASKYYDVPFFLKESRSFSILLRWITKAIRNFGTINSLNKEIQNLLEETGSTFKEAKTLRIKVANNIMFSHFRWK